MKNIDKCNILDYIQLIEKDGFLPSTRQKAFEKIKRLKLYTQETIWQARDRFSNCKDWINFLKQIA